MPTHFLLFLLEILVTILYCIVRLNKNLYDNILEPPSSGCWFDCINHPSSIVSKKGSSTLPCGGENFCYPGSLFRGLHC